MRPSPGIAAVFALLAAGSTPGQAGPLLPIYELQGAGHLSPYAGEEISTYGYVTAVTEDGYYLQDPTGDGDTDTSDAIFVWTAGPPAVEVGDFVELEAEVAEVTPGGPASKNLSITRLENPSPLPPTREPPGALPAAVVIGAGGRLPPERIIDNDNFLDFDPEEDGLDFFESLEGMLVTLKSPLVVCPSNPKAEVYAVVDGGTGATGMSKRGTLNLSPEDYNPERIQIQERPRSEPGPENGPINVGDLLDDVTGVMSYDGMYEVLSLEALTMAPGGIVPAVSALLPHPGRLRVASYHLKGLDPHVEDAGMTDQTDGLADDDVDDDLGSGRFSRLGQQIVENLRAPDILALQDVQDNDGAEITAVTDATQTLQQLVDAIVAAGGPQYSFVDSPLVAPATIDDNGTPGLPEDDTIVNPNGGQPGGNRRNAYLYNPLRVQLPAGALSVVEDANPADGDVFSGVPHPLVARFEFAGEQITLINVHLSDRAGGASVFGTIQPAAELQDNPLVNGGVDRRLAQAEELARHLDATAEPDAKFVVLGNVNESEFLAPARAFTRLTNLTETLENTERYTMIAQGNSMALDHVFASEALMKHAPRCEIVHLNCEFADGTGRASDRDPVVASFAVASPFSFSARTIDGSENNPHDPSMGRAGHHYIRTTQSGVADFADGMNYPTGSSPALNPNPLAIMQSDLPSARKISNVLCKTDGVQSAARLSSWTWQWGQFIDHDFGLTGGPGPDEDREFFPIHVPLGDPEFDPFLTGAMMIPFVRSGVMPGTGVTVQRETPNVITSFIDGSNVYGSDALRAHNLRSFSGGRLATQPGPDGELPPFNLYGRDNANDLGLPSESLLLAGDVRANEQCALTAAHALFVREHNRLAGVIADRYFSGADLDDPAIDAEIYQRARKFVGALIQNITYREFLPALLGPDALPSYAGYDESIDPSLSQEFANAAFRVGHTMVTPELLRFDQEGEPHAAGHLPLRNAFFNPPEVTEVGIDPYLRGLARQVQQEVDRFVIDDVRSFLFGPPGSGGLDLAALNIQRGRDHGLPRLNAVRESLGLPRAAHYGEIGAEAAAGFETLYAPGNVDAVDLWIGGISEEHLPGSQLGMTFHAIWVDQFTRLRDGDRFWFETDPFFTPEDVAEIRATTLADVIRRNSDALVQDDVFRVPTLRLAITAFSFEPATNTVTITWRSLGGERFEIQASDDYGSSQPFATIATVTGTAGTTTASFIDPAAAGKPRRAWRIVQP